MKRFEIYLPLYYGDGTRIEEEKFELTRRELVEKFGGLTVLPVPHQWVWASGCYSACYTETLTKYS